ncbi:MAG: CoA transferase [Dehalococcoidia bacterium]|nr:CoA transferase [Dehalococcoidia bacterium]
MNPETGSTGQALDDVVVLDLTHHIAGPYATKLLADFGADVIKVERPEGDISRRFGPFQGDEPHIEKSGLFFFLNTNKRSAVLDLRSDAGKAALEALIKRADLVVENFRPGVMASLGFDWDRVHALNPKASLISISNFGQDGPYRDYRLTELVLYGFAGEMYSMGETTREPMKMAGTAALFESGASIAAALMGTLWSNEVNGQGQYADIALAETHFGGVDRRHATAIAYQYSGRKTLRTAGAGSGMPQGIYPCADGYVDFTNAGLRPDRILDMLNHPEWALDPKYQDPMARLNAEIIEEWNGHFLGWCIERTKREVWDEARRAKVLCAPLFSMEDLYEDDHFRNRGFWTKVEHPVLGEVEMPGRPLIMPEGGWKIRRPAPLLGQHTEEVLREAGLGEDQVAAAANAAKGGAQ